MAFEDLHTHYVAASIELPPAAELVAMLDDGATYDSLAGIYNCSAATIRSRITNSGVRQQKTAPAEGCRSSCSSTRCLTRRGWTTGSAPRRAPRSSSPKRG